MSKWMDAVFEVISPRGVMCMGCSERSHGQYLCPNCRRALEAMRLPPDNGENPAVQSVYRYDGLAKRLVCMLKFELQTDAAEVLADGLAEKLAQMNLPSDVTLTWVTMPRRRCLQRGIDHGRTLCEAVGRRLQLPVKQLLERNHKHLHTQRGLSRKGRINNLRGAFCCIKQLSGTVVLIDDVTTSGATAAVCTEALMQAGADRVITLTATKAELRNDNLDYYKEVFKRGLYTS